jgi:pimeloyl-ACP methyl ester carboxylesterase
VGSEMCIRDRLVQGKSISQQELAVFKAEDDHATVTVDGQVVEIEQNNTNRTNTITYNTGTKQFNALNFSIDRSQKTYFLIHGYQSSPDTFKTHGDLASSLGSIDRKANIIYVDWSSVTKGWSFSWPYLSVVGQIPTVAHALSNTFKTLNIDPNNTEIIGHSLGAHVAGGAGYVYSQTTSNKISQVIGLDAAGVRNWTNGLDGRITTESASNVVGIHSTNSGDEDGFVWRPGFGWYDDYGNKDIYIYKDGYLWGQSFFNDTWNGVTNHSYPIELYSNLVKGQGYGSTSGNSSSDKSKFTNRFNLEFSSSPNGIQLSLIHI